MISENPSARVEKAFNLVFKNSMKDLPFISPNLRVEAVNFELYDDHWLGVIITPWMISIMLIPEQISGVWEDLKVSERKNIALANSTYLFTVSKLDDIGLYLSCSLMSPIEGIINHSDAVVIAQDVMQMITAKDPDKVNLNRRKLVIPIRKRL